MNILKLSLEIILLILLIIASYYDIRYRIIPNFIILLIIAVDIIYILLNQSFMSSFLGFFFPSVILILLNFLLKHFIGHGDIKLLMATGLFLGCFINLVIFVASCLLCIIFMLFYKLFFKKNLITLPFAPFICISTFLYIIIFLLNI